MEVCLRGEDGWSHRIFVGKSNVGSAKNVGAKWTQVFFLEILSVCICIFYMVYSLFVARAARVKGPVK